MLQSARWLVISWILELLCTLLELALFSFSLWACLLSRMDSFIWKSYMILSCINFYHWLKRLTLTWILQENLINNKNLYMTTWISIYTNSDFSFPIHCQFRLNFCWPSKLHVWGENYFESVLDDDIVLCVSCLIAQSLLS